MPGGPGGVGFDGGSAGLGHVVTGVPGGFGGPGTDSTAPPADTVMAMAPIMAAVVPANASIADRPLMALRARARCCIRFPSH